MRSASVVLFEGRGGFMRREARCLRLDFNVGRARSKFGTFATKTSKKNTLAAFGNTRNRIRALSVYHTYTNLNTLHIEAVGSRDLATPANARMIDLGGATLLPGFIDVHTHLTFDAGGDGYESLGISIPRAALTGAKNARLTLLAGFTSVRNVGAEGY